MSRVMPKQKPGRSETVVLTPPELLRSIKRFMGIKKFGIDLAALPDNAVSVKFLTPEDDALSLSWVKVVPSGTWAWLNPPYDKIAPWMKKACEWFAPYSTGEGIAVLIPASVGSEWWNAYVHEKAMVYFLRGRPTFLDKDGKPICSKKTGKPTPYPKDLALVLYGEVPGYDTLKWRAYDID